MNGKIGNKFQRTFGCKKVSIFHLVYIVIIFLIIQLFLFVIYPGHVNEAAFTNFSFASTLVSIVLAVVSIVYTIQSGLSSIGQFKTIQDIEERIHHEINKFSSIDEKI